MENCTFESPYGPTDLTDLGASTLNSLLPNTQMYFNGGAYDALNVPLGTNGVTLQASQSISSRTADYNQPATDAGRSTFNGAFILYGNNALNDIILLSTPATIGGNGVRITGGTNNVVTGSQICSTGDRYTIGLILNASQLNVTNNSIFGNSIGLSAQNQSRVSVKNSQFDTLDTTGVAISGIRLSVSNLLLDNSQITVSGTTSSVVGIRSIRDLLSRLLMIVL
ncbi:right-handed parallel beta-helix repeat-containing protein [Rickettsiella massiliensis]|uniref:right-handed parallel beta-helix repeat-containing protein n=1 Tax=Rickettsiella massiliensis TaxID=676517 RepID=UPI00029A6BE8|nr:right-handed parallel beta-helix repeat-containing protein [Rickettsiella massiliensis]